LARSLSGEFTSQQVNNLAKDLVRGANGPRMPLPPAIMDQHLAARRCAVKLSPWSPCPKPQLVKALEEWAGQLRKDEMEKDRRMHQRELAAATARQEERQLEQGLQAARSDAAVEAPEPALARQTEKLARLNKLIRRGAAVEAAERVEASERAPLAHPTEGLARRTQEMAHLTKLIQDNNRKKASGMLRIRW
jgi:hypothetical protein